MNFLFCKLYIPKVYHFLYKEIKKICRFSVIREIISMIFFLQRTSFNFCLWNSGFICFARGSGCTNICACVSRRLRAWMRQPCPLESGENASTAQDNDEIVLLVHCEIWIAGIRANEVAAGRSCSTSPSLFLVSHSLSSRFPSPSIASARSHLSSSSSSSLISRILRRISSHTLFRHLLSGIPDLWTLRERERASHPGNERSTMLFTTSETRKTAFGVYKFRCKLVRPDLSQGSEKEIWRRTIVKDQMNGRDINSRVLLSCLTFRKFRGHSTRTIISACKSGDDRNPRGAFT